MASLRGARGLFPCPVCLVPKDEQWKASAVYPVRTTKDARSIYRRAKTMLQKDREKLLKDHGMRFVQVSQLNVLFESAAHRHARTLI
jgi:hypothetical protein